MVPLSRSVGLGLGLGGWGLDCGDGGLGSSLGPPLRLLGARGWGRFGRVALGVVLVVGLKRGRNNDKQTSIANSQIKMTVLRVLHGGRVAWDQDRMRWL